MSYGRQSAFYKSYKKLPTMTEQDYAKLITASIAHGGHHHAGTNHHDPAQPNSDHSPSR